MRTLRPSKKLEHRNFGPYLVTGKINDNAFRLELPATLKIHPVLPVSILTKAEGTEVEPQPVHATDNNPDGLTWVVESLHGRQRRLLGKKKVDCVLVQWEGCGTDERTWEPVEEIMKDVRWLELEKGLQESTVTEPTRRRNESHRR
jgi:hypothetical protein